MIGETCLQYVKAYLHLLVWCKAPIHPKKKNSQNSSGGVGSWQRQPWSIEDLPIFMFRLLSRADAMRHTYTHRSLPSMPTSQHQKCRSRRNRLLLIVSVKCGVFRSRLCALGECAAQICWHENMRYLSLKSISLPLLDREEGRGGGPCETLALLPSSKLKRLLAAVCQTGYAC